MFHRPHIQQLIFYLLISLIGLSLAPAYASAQEDPSTMNPAEQSQDYDSEEEDEDDTTAFEEVPPMFEEGEYFEEEPFPDEQRREPAAIEGEEGYEEEWIEDQPEEDVYDEQTEPEARPEAFEYREFREQGENLD